MSEFKVGDEFQIFNEDAWIDASITGFTECGDYILESEDNTGLTPLRVTMKNDDKLGTHAQTVSTQPVKSDGGSSTYYDIPLPEWLVDKINQRGEGGQAFIKTEELIEVGFNNDFDAGNIQKSLVRAWGVFNGGGKEGNSLEYESNKIRYSLDKLLDRKERGE